MKRFREIFHPSNDTNAGSVVMITASGFCSIPFIFPFSPPQAFIYSIRHSGPISPGIH
jgi:hypothetical protein